MSSELNKQVTKLKIQAKTAGIKLRFDEKEDLIMIYPDHRDDICASLGYTNNSNVYICSYIVDLKRLRYANDEGFSKDQIQKDKRLNVLKEVRPDVIINHLS
jgi:hypothetical protein